MGRGTVPPESFRVQPWEAAPDYCLVHISPTLEEMRRVMVEHTGWCHPQQLACCIGCTPADQESRELHGALVGILFFAQNTLGAGIVSHELAHATFRSMDAMDVRVAHWSHGTGEHETSWTEELYCICLERLTRTFWTEAYAREYVS